MLLEQYQLLQVARKVVGVGSVGTRAWILLMEGVDGEDPMSGRRAGAELCMGDARCSGEVALEPADPEDWSKGGAP
jgi:hypothetical protein